MPIPVFGLDEDATNDVVLREDFLTYTRNLLDHIVTNAVDENNEIATLFTAESANFMKNAWEEVLPLFEAWTGEYAAHQSRSNYTPWSWWGSAKV